MSRCTERDEFGNANVIGANAEKWIFYLECDELNKMTDALNKLADYEDAEEAAERSCAENAAPAQAAQRCDGHSPLILDELLQLEGEPVWCENASGRGTVCFWALCWHGNLLTPAGERIAAKKLIRGGTLFYRRKPARGRL